MIHNRKQLSFCVALFLGLLSNSAYAETSTVATEITVTDIQSRTDFTLFANQQQSLFSFFEPNCSWCLRQIKALNKLQQQCSVQVNITLIGIHGNKQQLRKVLHKARNTLPATQYHPELRKLLGKINVTPTNAFFDQNSTLVSSLPGYIKLDKLSKVFAPDCKIH